jgi:predicted GNAT family N-acyltransferase
VTAVNTKRTPTDQDEIHTWVIDSLDQMEDVIAIRNEVFVEEQGLAGRVADDPDDRYSVHVLAAIGDEVVGTGRALFVGDQSQIAWVAVRRPYRGRGVGRAIMEHLLQISKDQGVRVVTLNAQTHALRFYEALGFEPYGRRFYMSNIEHQHMMLDWTVTLR